MRVLCLLFAMVSGIAFAAETHDVFYPGMLAPLNTMPTFDKGYLVVYDFDSKITLYTPDGSLMYSATAHIDDATYVRVWNAGVDTDGTLAAAIDYKARKANARSGGIAIFDRTGLQTKFFVTGAYWPTQVAFGPDHSIWTIGYREASDGSKNDYFVLRNYSREGQEIGAFLPRSSFPPQPDPVGPCIGGWQLRVVNGKVGALFYGSSLLKPGQESRPMLEWVETDLKGKELGRYDVPGARFALTQAGNIYAQLHGVRVFERATSSWRPVPGMPDGTLLGADGNSLVFNLKGTNVLRWVPASQ